MLVLVTWSALSTTVALLMTVSILVSLSGRLVLLKAPLLLLPGLIRFLASSCLSSESFSLSVS